MPVVKIRINDKVHQIACQEGEELHVENLAAEFSRRVNTLAKSYPNATDTTLYMMAGLMVCDELHEAKKDSSENKSEEDVENAVVKTIDMVTEHINHLAKKINS
ncbi:MAG: cell division protein ZapA [Rickettsiales bacterium]